MRKLSLLLLSGLLTVSAFGQNKQHPKRVATPDQLNQRETYDPIFQQNVRAMEPRTNLRAIDISNPAPTPAANGKTTTVNPVGLGRASNAFSWLRTQQNQVVAVDSLGLVIHIHRQDITIFGGGTTENGKFRYDLSNDNGITWTNDVGPLQTVYTNYGRYPQLTVYNPSNSANPFDSKVVYHGPTNKFPTPGWVGYVKGTSDIATTSPASSDMYEFDGRNTLLPGGLCKGTPGTFWFTDNTYDGTNLYDTIRVFKGTWNSSTEEVDWIIQSEITPTWSTSYDGTIHAVGSNMDFSPDGQDGWVGFVGDLAGGRDSVYRPIFIHSSDGGNTWGTPIEVELNNIPWIKDSLQILWVDSLGNPASTGDATTAFDCDITVDANGNPHMGVIIGSATSTSAPDPGYSISSGLAMFMADVYSTDGGATWQVEYLAPCLTLRGEFGVPDGNGALLTMDNVCQASRTEDGTKVFFAWVDTDTNSVGFGTTDNLSPNLRIVGRDVTDGTRTCWKRITDGDLIWEGKALFPCLAPIVRNVGSEYWMPVVMIELIVNDQQQPTRGWYFGQDCYFNDSEFQSFSGGSGSWDGQCYTTARPVPVTLNTDAVTLGAYPNPAEGSATLFFDLTESMQVDFRLVNVMGQQVATLAEGNFAKGRHEFSLDAAGLSAGIYYFTLHTAKGNFSGKLVVAE